MFQAVDPPSPSPNPPSGGAGGWADWLRVGVWGWLLSYVSGCKGASSGARGGETLCLGGVRGGLEHTSLEAAVNASTYFVPMAQLKAQHCGSRALPSALQPNFARLLPGDALGHSVTLNSRTPPGAQMAFASRGSPRSVRGGQGYLQPRARCQDQRSE